MALSKLAERCVKCSYKDDCDVKRMAACAYMEKPPLVAEAAQLASQQIMQPILKSHDYRNIKIDTNTTITIDLEEVKQKLIDDRYKAIRLHFGA